jgi:hypothetical protein
MTCHTIITWLLTNIFRTFSQQCHFLKPSLPFAFSDQIYMHLSLQSCISYMPRPSNPPLFVRHIICWEVTTMKLVTLSSSPVPCYTRTALSALFLSTPVCILPIGLGTGYQPYKISHKMLTSQAFDRSYAAREVNRLKASISRINCY